MVLTTTTVKGTYDVIIYGTIAELGINETITLKVIVEGNYGPPYFKPSL